MWGSIYVYVLLLLSCVPAHEDNIKDEEFEVEKRENNNWSNGRLTREVKALKEAAAALSESEATPQDVIFYQASLRHDTSYDEDETIIFDDIEVNQGDAYQNGVFTAPVKGVYFLWAHISRRDRCCATVEIRSSKTGTILTGEHVGDTHTCGASSIWGQGTLGEGESIWVTATADRIITVRGERFSSAGATLIKVW